ncbi:MAG: Gfo/Idh/MocA family oxidoreductase, partial [Armatimonadota bacterium]
MERKLGAAVIGLGMMGERHARIWAELPQTELLAVYDIRPEPTAALAALYGIEPCDSIEAALNTPGVDIVSVCT